MANSGEGIDDTNVDVVEKLLLPPPMDLPIQLRLAGGVA